MRHCTTLILQADDEDQIVDQLLALGFSDEHALDLFEDCYRADAGGFELKLFLTARSVGI